MFEITEVLSAQIKEARGKATASGCQESVLGVELGEVDVPAVPIRRSLPQEDAKLGVVLERLNLLMILIMNSHFSVRVHTLRKQAHLGGVHEPLLLLLL